ncbi:MAG TPA: enoyl-CoA hydratase/isomerase family protein [Steroidobacteraceae bacterium]|nr:enoyl-CoA hydratase/isomerase family protein [Steroidobacteraceae bacterium]HQW08442.1 enoyl-CoA hydratase/isomerase family protein [Steroidobacteraceae bacterium]HQX46657.1 enoyl-CoA hydratase/isomerase family protein [Steroidobacteraceae bacterium]HQX77954.1 enoyl-CoA hydratase/isomerase family protein [Steroidobacteraceae bacterium]HQZ79630.1 enoyl-CoA hydratase/isomerase family protein [Steroidobacteraceae bacterium]
MTDTVMVDIRGEVAVVTLNRPETANTLNLAMGRDLLTAALRCEADPAVRAVVLTGAGKAFCFGGDLRGMTSSGTPIEPYLKELTTHLHAAIARFMRMDAPVIAAVNGTTAGAGVGLVAMADLAIMAAGAKISLAYTGVGLTPDGGTSFLLPRAVGAKRAMELIMTNRALTAAEALEWGLVNQVAPDTEVLDTALALAGKLAAGPKGAFGRSKRLVAAALGALESQLTLESETIAAQAATAEGREGITAFFEKRKAQYAR